MFPPQVFTSQFWEELVYPENKEKRADLSLPAAVLFCLSVDKPEELSWPQVHSLVAEHFPEGVQIRVFETFIFLFSAHPQPDPEGQAQALIAAAPALGDLTFTISYEEAGASLGAWRLAAQRTIAAVRSKVLYGAGRIYRFANLGPKRKPSVSLTEKEEELLLAIKTGRAAEALEAAERSSKELFSSNLYVLSHLRTRLRELAVLMTHAAVEAGLSDQAAFGELNNLFRGIDREHDYTRLKELYQNAAGRLAQLVQEANRRPSALVQEAKVWLEKNFRRDLSLQQAAEALAVSPSHLSRRFRQETGFTFTEYLNKLRLEEAARLLLDRSLSVTEVCYQVGFQSLSHFQRLFRDFYGKSPSAYRKKH